MIHIDKRGKRVEIRSELPLPGLKSAIPGAYQNANGIWTVPLNYETCLLLQERYGKRLKVGTELRRWATGVKESREYMSTLAAADDAKLLVLPHAAPKLHKAMKKRKYQRVGVRFIADGANVLIADDPGLGKTLIAIGGIIESEIAGPHLIIAPKTASRPVWEREIQRWLPEHHRAVTLPELRLGRERKLRRTKFDESTWLIVHPEMVLVQVWMECGKCGHKAMRKKARQRMLPCGHEKDRKTVVTLAPSYPHLFKTAWGCVVVDESHESLIRRSGTPTQRRLGMDTLIVRADGKRLAMSGTPMDSKPHQLFGTLNWLAPTVHPAFHRWVELFWRKGGAANGYDIGEFIKEREPLLWGSLSSICLRRTKAEVAQDLPPKMEVGTRLNPHDETSPIGVWLDMEGKQAAAYERMLKHSSVELASGRLEAITALAELTRLKQLASSHGDIETREVRVRCAKSQYPHDTCKRGYHDELRLSFVPGLPSNKFNWVSSTLEEWGYPRDPIGKVVIVSFYTSLLMMFARGLKKHFKTKPGKRMTTMIRGATKNKGEVLDRFNADGNEHIMLLNLRAGGTAITIDSADRMIFLTESRIPDQQTQAEDRIHRVSNPRQCMYYYLRSLGTVDVGTAIANQELAKDTHRLLDGRRGIDYLRYVIEHSR